MPKELTEKDLPEGWLLRTNIMYGGSGHGDEMWASFLYRWGKIKRFLRKPRHGWKMVLSVRSGNEHDAVMYAIATQKMIDRTKES